MTERTPVEQEQINFRIKLNDLVEKTKYLSGSFSSHPDALALLQYGTKALPWMLEYVRECKNKETDQIIDSALNPWVALDVIHKLVQEEDLPPIPKETLGKLEPLLDIFEEWGVQKGYLTRVTPPGIEPGLQG